MLKYYDFGNVQSGLLSEACKIKKNNVRFPCFAWYPEQADTGQVL